MKKTKQLLYNWKNSERAPRFQFSYSKGMRAAHAVFSLTRLIFTNILLTVCTHVVPFNRVLEILKRAPKLPQAPNTVIWLWTMLPDQSMQMCKCASRQMFCHSKCYYGNYMHR